MIRLCPECGEEFRPEIERCSDCGAALGPAIAEDAQPAPAAATPRAEVAYEMLVRDLAKDAAQAACDRLAAAGVRFRLGAHGYSLVLSVARDDAATARRILEEAGLATFGGEAAPAVSEDGGSCPACGTDVAAGVEECPTCGLALAGEMPERCPDCGGDLSPAGGCGRCG